MGWAVASGAPEKGPSCASSFSLHDETLTSSPVRSPLVPHKVTLPGSRDWAAGIFGGLSPPPSPGQDTASPRWTSGWTWLKSIFNSEPEPLSQQKGPRQRSAKTRSLTRNQRNDTFSPPTYTRTSTARALGRGEAERRRACDRVSCARHPRGSSQMHAERPPGAGRMGDEARPPAPGSGRHRVAQDRELATPARPHVLPPQMQPGPRALRPPCASEAAATAPDLGTSRTGCMLWAREGLPPKLKSSGRPCSLPGDRPAQLSEAFKNACAQGAGLAVQWLSFRVPVQRSRAPGFGS